jgi:uncharacterized membrane protein YhhN
MREAALPLLGFTLVAVIDWVAVAFGWKPVEYVAKPLALLLLIDVALTLDPTDGSQRAWFVAALVFCVIGDVLLMLPTPRFVEGLGAFLVGHVCYIAGFWVAGASAGARVAALVVVFAIGAAACVPLVRSLLAQHRDMVVPVAAYMVVISLMVASAGASGLAVAAVGAALFWVSDYLIGWNTFVKPITWAPVVIMVTYHLGQLGLVLALPN